MKNPTKGCSYDNLGLDIETQAAAIIHSSFHSSSFRSVDASCKRELLDGKPFVPVRVWLVLLGTCATAIVFALRVNLSVAIVAMVNQTAVTSLNQSKRNLVEELIDDKCFANGLFVADNGTITRDIPRSEQGEYVWSQSTQGLVLGAYYYGYATTQVIGGRFAEKYSGRWLCGIGVFVSAIATLLTPIASNDSVILIVTLRAVIGIFHGFVYTSMYSMCAVWFPKNERSTALAMITVGGNMGAALTMPLSGYLVENGFAGGWPSVFYSTGIFSLLWLCIWMYYVRDSPADHPSMTAYEFEYITSGTEMMVSKKGVRAPWRKILSSPAVWSIAAGKSCGMFGYYMLATKLPMYLEAVLRVPIQRNGVINALVYVAVSVTMAVSGPLSDYIKRNVETSLTCVRRTFETIALTGTAICLAVIPFAGCNEDYVTGLLLMSMILFGFTTGGDIPIVADLAPHFTGTIFGLTNTISVTMGFFAPIITGIFLDGNAQSRHQWAKVFYLSAGLSVLGNIIFCLWAKAAPASWGVVKKVPDLGREQRRTKPKRESYHSFGPAFDRPQHFDITAFHSEKIANISQHFSGPILEPIIVSSSERMRS